jgi:hypothetical protein
MLMSLDDYIIMTLDDSLQQYLEIPRFRAVGSLVVGTERYAKIFPRKQGIFIFSLVYNLGDQT